MLADVPSWRSRLIAVVAVLVVISGHLAECRGWLATPEARMACCENEQQCPMHKSGAHRDRRTVTQAEADRCCAANSQTDHSVPSATQSAPADSIASTPAIIAVAPLTVVGRAVRIETDLRPPTGRSRHVLLSVFLI
jgi:hypothetical protein